MVAIPETLPQRMFLLAYDTRKQRPALRGEHLGFVLRAAALTELYLDGRLGEEDGKPVPGTPGPDPYGVVAQIGASRPRPWPHWVRKDARRMVRTVRDELESGGWIRLRPRRVLGLFPVTAVEVRDPRVLKALSGSVSSALRGRPAAHVNSLDAAAVALAAAGEVRTVVPRAENRRYRARIAALTARSGPAAPGLRKAIRQQRAVMASATG
ncbi:GPP34 family phosphoprotein [Actinomadura logoneensis]|uniref:GPP34 family phosphoprotein n=1 Tax=Actinomadura logoneensis TaxID=2293572 RepID=A0A372JHB9_9ACTN|nr:GPP34 family phosphoprotein [Actinomadura logoneensis]RFU39412.1 GPP34 family phosphoprotein [Actinomadura logoneensis]